MANVRAAPGVQRRPGASTPLLSRLYTSVPRRWTWAAAAYVSLGRPLTPRRTRRRRGRLRAYAARIGVPADRLDRAMRLVHLVMQADYLFLIAPGRRPRPDA